MVNRNSVPEDMPTEKVPASPRNYVQENAERIQANISTFKETFKSAGMTMNWEAFVEQSFLVRTKLLDRLIDPRRNIDDECGYPQDITPWMYHMLYERDGIAKRVVEVYPDESWSMDPELIEDESDNTLTKFEGAWNDLQQRLHLWSIMHRADVLSGVGRFGVVLLGLADGRDYMEPADGLNDRGEAVPGAKNDLLFTRVFDEVVVRVNMRESNINNPRFGQPTIYTVTFKDLDITELAGSGIATVGDVTKRVHWTRLVHLADNRQMSEIYGTPRMKPVFNRIVDIRKILGGSAEMFWKGAFPGLSFELHPGIGDAELDMKSLREEMDRYQNGLQRYLAIAGMSAKSLAPTVADPTSHLKEQLQNIAIALGIPNRILYGAEEAKLASNQDTRTWNKRVTRRQEKYLGPFVIRPFIDRLVALGVLPEPKRHRVWFPDLNTTTDKEKAEVAFTRTQALTQYVAGDVQQLVGPQEFLTYIMSMDADDVRQIMQAAMEHARMGSVDVEDKPIGGKTKPNEVGIRSPLSGGVPMLEDAAADQMEKP